MGDRDPVARVLGDREDLYDVAEWDPRSALDSASIGLYRGLHAARKYVLILFALVLFVAQLAFAGILVVDQPRLGILAALSALPAVALVGYVWYRDPTRREPIETLAITFVLAVLFASFAAIVNSVFSSAFRAIPVVGMALYFFLVVGPIEEAVKWLAIRVYAFDHDAFGAVIDGAVYGAVAGLGFATIENALYITQGYMQAADAGAIVQLQRAAQTATGRALVGPGHVLYSSFAGYYLGLAKFNRENAGPIVVKGLLIAALIHATYNTLVSTLPFGAFGVPYIVGFLGFILLFDGVVAYALYRKLSRYRRAYHRAQSAGDPRTEPTAADGRGD